MRRTIQLTNVEGAGAAGIFSCQLPMGLDYFAFYLVDAGATAVIAEVTNVKHYWNGDIMRDLSGTQQQQFNLCDKLGAMAVDNILPLHLDMLQMKTIQATYGPTMNTLSPDPETGKTITSSRLEFTNTTVAPQWQLWADVDDNGAGGPGFCERIKVFGNNNIGTAEKSFATVLPFGTPDVRYWRRILVSNISAGNITLARILRSSANNEIFKRSRTLDTRILADYFIRANGTGVNFSIDGTETGIPETFDTMMPVDANDPKKGLITVGQMDLRLTGSAAATVDLLHNAMGKF